MTLLMSMGNKEQSGHRGCWAGCRRCGRAQRGKGAGMDSRPGLGHLESRVLVTKVGDLGGGGKEESVEGTVPRVLASKPSLGVATLNTQEALAVHPAVTVSDRECSFWYPQLVGRFPTPEPP